jgi:hypothetical protein
MSRWRIANPKILESRLNDLNPGHRFEVINHTMPGLSVRQKFHIVESYAKNYSPDLIILDYVMNDVEFESKKDARKEHDQACFIALIDVRIPCALKTYLMRSTFALFAKEAVENILNREDRTTNFYKKVAKDYYHRLYATPERTRYFGRCFSPDW